MKKRLDIFLLESGLAPNINIARSLIMQGLVHNENKQLLKAGIMISDSEVIKVKNKKGHSYVSRGALKLQEALQKFDVSVSGKICLDIGCSTGGFTEVLLEHGAKTIYAVDVAYGEIHPKLRDHPNVILHERLNARYITREHIPTELDIIVCDASFISLKTVLPPSFSLGKKDFDLIALIKPQFEALKQEVGEKGIITDIKVHEKICDEIKSWLESNKFNVAGIIPSPILGMKGNKEFLIHAKKYE